MELTKETTELGGRMIKYNSVAGWMEFPKLSVSDGLTATIRHRLQADG